MDEESEFLQHVYFISDLMNILSTAGIEYSWFIIDFDFEE